MNNFTPNNSEKPRQKLRLETRLKTSILTDAVIIVTLAALFIVTTLSNQPLEDVFFSMDTPLEVTVCSDSYTFSVEYLNTSGFPLTEQEITLDLPAGVKYIAGSLNDTSSYQVIEADISDLGAPVFTLDDLGDGESVGFSIDYEISIPARDEILNGRSLQNKVILESNEGVVESLSVPYNALYAALNIIKINPANQSLVSGDTASRTIKIVNGGYGKLSSFFLTDIHGDGIELVGTDLGQINATKDTIFLSGSDFSGIGNGDNFFDNNETIVITERLLAFGCAGGTISSSIDAGWSCKGETVPDASMNANISTSLKLPVLSLSTQNALSTCFGPSTPNTQEISVKNTGQGIAIDVELDIWKSTGGNYTENIFSRFDTSSLQISVNGKTAEKIVPRLVYTTKNTGDYACLGSNPIGRVILDLPNLSPNATAVISWDTYNCCIDVCKNETNTGWKTEITYTDACETSVKTASKVGENDLRGKMTIFTESPYHLQAGQIGEYVYTVSSFKNALPKGEGAHYELVFDIPLGLKWNGNSGDLNFISGTKSWTATSIVYDNNSRTLTAKYPHPEPFKLPKSELQLKLEADCSNLSGQSNEVDLGMKVNYIADTTCTESCSIPFFCSEITTTKIMCPAPCNEGINMTGFQIFRNSFGVADNDQNGLPDTNPQLDMNKVKRKRVMVGDSLRATFQGSIHASANTPSFSYGYASSKIEEGDELTSIGATVKIYDASTGSYITCDQVVVTESNGSFYYDFSPAILGTSCASLSGFQFENGDSLWLYADYKVSGNIGGKIKQVNVDNSFYLSTIANPTSGSDKYGCGVWGDRFTLIGYYFVNEKASKTTISSCNKVINQDFKLSIGDCCSNYNGGNLFPYEYRQWGHVKKAQFTIPDHYEVLDIYMKHRATKFTNATITKTIKNIQPDSVVGNTYHLNIEQFLSGHGGTVIKSDDGFRATLYVELAPSCDVPENTYQDVDWKVSFQESEWLSNSETDWYTSNPDQIRFSPPALQLSSPTPIIDGLGKNISWTLNVKSGGGGSDNSWIHVKNPNNDVTITSIVDQESGDTLAYSGDIYKLGAISSNATKKLSVNARYTACQPTYIDVFAGYECSAYPDSFANFKCNFTQTKLEVEPEPAELQMRLKGDRFSENCVVYTDIEVELASVKQGYVGDIQLKVQLPGNTSMSLVNDSTKIKYPISGSYNYIQNPTVSNDEFVIDINNEVAEIAYDGMVGITNTAKNRMKVAFRIKNESGYKAGDLITIVANSYEPCGKPLPSITVPFDVNMKFTRPIIAGLTDDKGNNWSGAWGDFNNDGYEDLYVAEFNHWEAGKLYINNGNGQFTVSTSAGAPIQDKGASAGATWGDYDNDGDLDLFVSNNVRAVNHLYQNNGDGTFTRQDSIGDISSYEGYCHNAAWIDYDNDGWLDIFVSDYMPTRYNQLYHNNGDGSFSRATDNPIALEAKFSMGATWADYDNDGLLDLFVPNGRDDNNSLYHNEGNGQFTKITEGDIVNDGGNSTGSSWGDYDNDGDLDLFVTNASNQNNFFYVNNGDGSFTKNYTSIISQEGGHSHGSGWADMNKDGFLDLFVGNDAGNVNFFYVNNGDGTFRRSEMFDEDLENTMGVAFADYDIDGDLDIFLANNGNQNNTIYNNEADPCISWKCFELKGVRSNKSAVGAKVRIKSSIYGKSIWQTREISTQTGGGSSSQSTIRAYFGLGDASNIDSVIIDWPSGFEQHLTNVSLNDCQTVIEEDGAEICGLVYYDLNGNCQQDKGEPGVPNILLEVMPGPKYVTTNDSGEYRIYRQYGTYTISSISTDEWSNVGRCDSSHTIVYESANKASSLSFCGKNFAMSPSCPKPDLVSYLSSTALRRGFRNSYAISFLNRGALGASNLELVVEFDNDIIPLSADVPWDQMTKGPSVTEFVWNLRELNPMQQGTIMITDSVSATATLGKRAEVRAYFRNPPDDCDLSNNMRIDYNEVVGAVDPNDILVFPAGAIEKEDELTYKIRFQNVGTKFAQRVFIQDTISPYLDLASFELQGASHDYKYQISEDRVISFTFDRIFLPDSNSNEAASHGFIEYKITPGQAIPAGILIENRAAIQFDYNEFIITNTVQNQIVNSLEWAEQNKLYLSVSPNPLEVEAQAEIRHIEDAGIRIDIDKLEIYTLNGSLLSASKDLNASSVSIRKSQLKTGLYLVKAYDKNGFSYTEKLEVK